MRINEESTLKEALTHWGRHEASKRYRTEISFDPTDDLGCLNFILQRRSPYIARIISRVPLDTFRASIEPNDSSALLLANGWTIDRWITHVKAEKNDSFAHFSRLVEEPECSEGSLVCAAEVIDQTANQLGAVVLYDGWHRVAAWFERLEMGRSSDIDVYLIVTGLADPLLMPTPTQPSTNSLESDALKATRASS